MNLLIKPKRNPLQQNKVNDKKAHQMQLKSVICCGHFSVLLNSDSSKVVYNRVQQDVLADNHSLGDLNTLELQEVFCLCCRLEESPSLSGVHAA